MKKHETLSKGEELFVHVLEECLDEDLSFIPPEREIARTHKFSQKFEDAMNALLEKSSGNHKEQEIRRHFSPRYGHLVACVLVFCICGGLLYQVAGSLFDRQMEKSAAGTAAQDMSADTGSPAGESAAETEEAAPEAGAALDVAYATEEESSASEEKAETEAEPAEGAVASLAETKNYCGQTVTLAAQQEVPETLEYVTTLVNCPVQDEEDPVLYLTIGNIGEEEVQYLNHYDLEVWIDGGWYVIPSGADEKGEWMTLEPGMAVDEEIDLADYQVDYDAQQYRLITYVGQGLISAEFTFEEVFAETMEKLEGESSGE